MEIVSEFFLALVGVGIYGTEERPRHPIWRNLVRIVAFGGAAIAMMALTTWDMPFEFSWATKLAWGICFLVVLIAEYEIGSTRLAIAAVIVMVLLIGAVFSQPVS